MSFDGVVTAARSSEGKAMGRGNDAAVREHDFPVESLYIHSSGRAKLAVRLMRSPQAGQAVVLIVPAMGARARFYDPLARCLYQAGLHVVTADLRGQGESSPPVRRGVAFGYREIVEDDLPSVVQAIRTEIPGAPVVLAGHSLGGQLSLLSSATALSGARAIVLTACGSGWWRGFGAAHGTRYLIGSQILAGLASMLGYWPGEKIGFGGTQPAAVMRDWARQCRTGRYELERSSTDYETALSTLKLPVLAITVENDQLAPTASVEHLLAKIPAATISRWHYTQSLAGGRQLGHFRWVHHSEKVSKYIADWIAGILPAEERAGEYNAGTPREERTST